MNKHITRYYLALALLGFASVVCAEPPNLQTEKNKLIEYHDSGAYEHEIADVANSATEYLQQQVALNNHQQHPKKLAVVFDIDDTALSNYQDMRQLNFGGTLDSIDKRIADGHDRVIKPTLELYNFARSQHVAVFFITGRHNNERHVTIRNLREAGYRDWSGLTMKPRSYHLPSAVPYKSQARADIEKQGYVIVETIGDQYSDLNGGHAQKGFKLPNPYYFLP